MPACTHLDQITVSRHDQVAPEEAGQETAMLVAGCSA